MHLTEEQVTKYQAIYKSTFGKSITRKDALAQGLALARLVKAITRNQNINKENVDENERSKTAAEN